MSALDDATGSTESVAAETATLAGGCFWCLEAVFLELRGVSSVVSGYAGGKRPNPSYEQVCSGATGHAEVVQVTFDPAVIAYRDLLDVFFTIHDPTTLNRQGNDSGTQYRSAVFFHSPEQERAAGAAIADLTAQAVWDDPIVTEVVPLEKFWPAEAYHQNYFANNPQNSYCTVVVAPKVAKARKLFFERLMRTLLVLTLGALASSSAAAQGAKPGASVDWPNYGNDKGGLKYSPLADVNRENVSRLTVAFTWAANEQPIAASDGQKPARPGQFQATPLAIHDTLFFPTPFNRVIALDAVDGRELWAFDPEPWKTYGQPSNGTGFVHRGVATWSNGRGRRVFINSRWRLFALDAATGKPIPTFGDNGQVDLTANLSRPVRKEHYTNTSPPVVWGNLVILGNGVGDRLVYRGDPPGDIQAFDVRTGKRVWRFKTVPEPGEYGNDTWKDSSWRYIGHTNAWAPFTVDSARGLVYLPVGTPSDDWYGGERKGANLFGETILCLDARTGKRVWHFQIAHHGLWDYDPPAPPNLLTVTHGGKRVDVVAVPTKQGFLFVFDRVTGTPLWPIEERPVPQSDVPGEESWPTQPFPTRPAPFTRQGFTVDDLADFTPEIRRAALAEVSKYRLGAMYAPPSMQGTLVMPGVIGGAGWGGAAVDPQTGWLYVKATNTPALFVIEKRDAGSDTVDTPYMVNLGRQGVSLRMGDGAGGRGSALPINRPPYGTLTAIDLNSGDTKWQIPFGDSPDVRAHPALKGVALPDKLGVSGSPGALVTKGNLIFSTGGGRGLYALDSRTGQTIWEYDLGQIAYANPMTYRTRAGRQMIAIATGAGATSTLVVFALPQQ